MFNRRLGDDYNPNVVNWEELQSSEMYDILKLKPTVSTASSSAPSADGILPVIKSLIEAAGRVGSQYFQVEAAKQQQTMIPYSPPKAKSASVAGGISTNMILLAGGAVAAIFLLTKKKKRR